MSLSAFRNVATLEDGRLKGTHKAVLFALANFADENGACWPAQESIARVASVDVRTVRRITMQLAEWGMLHVACRGVGRGYAYVILVGMTPEAADAAAARLGAWLHVTVNPADLLTSYGQAKNYRQAKRSFFAPEAPDPLSGTPDPLSAPPDPLSAPPDPLSGTPDLGSAPPDPLSAPPDLGSADPVIDPAIESATESARIVTNGNLTEYTRPEGAGEPLVSVLCHSGDSPKEQDDAWLASTRIVQPPREGGVEEQPPDGPAPLAPRAGEDALTYLARTAGAPAPVNYAVPPEAGGACDYDGDPVLAFCALAGTDYDTLPAKKRRQWAREIEKVGTEWEVSPLVTSQAIGALQEIYPWKTYSSPFGASFKDDLGLSIHRLLTPKGGASSAPRMITIGN